MKDFFQFRHLKVTKNAFCLGFCGFLTYIQPLLNLLFLLTLGHSVHYICSQYLADSSLSEDVSQYDFSTPVQVKFS